MQNHLATIAILSAVTLTAVGTSVTMYYNTFKQTKAVMRRTVILMRRKDAALDKKVNAILGEEKQNHPVKDQFEIEMVPVKGKFERAKSRFIGM